MTDDGGENWNTLDIKKLTGVPERAYINDIKADLFDEYKVYMAVDLITRQETTSRIFL